MPVAVGFTPVHSFLGGLILSSSVSALLVQTGTVLGISGFFHSFVASIFIRIPRTLFHQLSSSSSTSHNAATKQQTSDHTAQSTARFFTLGLLSSGLLLAAGRRSFEGKLGIQLFDDALSTSDIVSPISSSPLTTLLLGIFLPGFLVGVGTKLGSGCTSGHFLCGLSRLSPRSIAATATFFSIAVVTNLLQPLAHLLPYHPSSRSAPSTQAPFNPEPLLLLAFQIPAFVYWVISPRVIAGRGPHDDTPEAQAEHKRRHEEAARVTSFSTGVHFGIGLALSGMLRPSKVTGFLNLSPAHFAQGTWDPSLAMVALGGILPASFHYFTYILPKVRAQRGMQQQQQQHQQSAEQHLSTSKSTAAMAVAPSLSAAAPLWRVPVSQWGSLASTRIDTRLIAGAALFGVGWGLSGLCPGPVLVSLGGNTVPPPPTSDAGLQLSQSSPWEKLRDGLLAQPGTAGSLIATALFTASMAIGGLLV
ncbi:hypothetical protein OC846_001424 [Tilletia horrida]|uniref:Sulphur transport domain-containing protein n=1 Tax=Tilletia horrida TaxID=155126 RepID=A0AAN6JTV2_9BASI|nr:hypothetical protein OC845_001521 [Tilletia horrida]KAK0556094.1 hypothetical protein OC846_001424 [Tilletia horrida]KAK0568775.1 hypothetical protein OC861_001627 [Tilletia horrida]